jgi:hypothetical protein
VALASSIKFYFYPAAGSFTKGRDLVVAVVTALPGIAVASRLLSSLHSLPVKKQASRKTDVCLSRHSL